MSLVHMPWSMQAMAAHNSGGKVIVQVERLVDRGSIHTRSAHIPGAIVDKVCQHLDGRVRLCS